MALRDERIGPGFPGCFLDAICEGRIPGTQGYCTRQRLFSPLHPEIFLQAGESGFKHEKLNTQ